MNAVAAVIAAAEEPGGKIQTHHAWFPEWFEILFGSIAFVIIVWGLNKFAIPMLKNALAARTERIGNELARSRAEREQAAADAESIRAGLGDIESERTRMLADAETTVARIRTDGAARIAAEAAEAEARGRADIDASQGRLSGEIQNEISGLAAAATEQVVMGSLNDATQQNLIEEFIAKVGAR